MRIAPLAFLGNLDDPAYRKVVSDVCRITHRSDEAYLGALAFAWAVQLVSSSDWQWADSLAGVIAGLLPDSRVRDALLRGSQARASSIRDLASTLGVSGFVAESVPFAISAASIAIQLDFEEAIRRVVTCGGDTDTNASFVGQLLGASLGASGLPSRLRTDVEGQTVANFAELTARHS